MTKTGAAESSSMNRPGQDASQRVLQDLGNAIKGKTPEARPQQVDNKQNDVAALNKALGKSTLESVV